MVILCLEFTTRKYFTTICNLFESGVTIHLNKFEGKATLPV